MLWDTDKMTVLFDFLHWILLYSPSTASVFPKHVSSVWPPTVSSDTICIAAVSVQALHLKHSPVVFSDNFFLPTIQSRCTKPRFPSFLFWLTCETRCLCLWIHFKKLHILLHLAYSHSLSYTTIFIFPAVVKHLWRIATYSSFFWMFQYFID